VIPHGLHPAHDDGPPRQIGDEKWISNPDP